MTYNSYYHYTDLHKILNSCAERVEQSEMALGKPNKVIDTFYDTYKGSYTLINQCRIYLDAKIVIIITTTTLHIIPFNSIIGYDIVDLKKGNTPLYSATTTTTKTNTGDLVKRAVIGGVIAGGVGAVIGGLTAKRTTKHSDDFASAMDKYYDSIPNVELVIKFNNILLPSIKIPFEENIKNAEDFAESLNVIIKRNAESETIDDSGVKSYNYNIDTISKSLGIVSIDPYSSYKQEDKDKEEKQMAEMIISFFIIAAIIIVFCMIRCS